MKEILITSSFLILALVFLRHVFARKVSRRLIYATWLLVALRLLIPVQIGQTDLSILAHTQALSHAITNISDTRVLGQTQSEAHQKVIVSYIENDRSVFTSDVQAQIEEDMADGNSVQDVANQLDKLYNDSEIFEEHIRPEIRQQVEQNTNSVTIGQVATVIWLTGMVGMATWFLIVNLKHNRRIHAGAKKLKTEGSITVYVSENVGSPCLTGLFRPSVYLSPVCVDDEKLLRHVLAHELTHYAHWDHVWSVVRCLCLCIYWFDPLVWLAAFLSCRDCELACDEGALKRLGEEERFSYGEALLAVVDHDSSRKRLLRTATTMNESKQQLNERVCLIVKRRNISQIAAICVILLCTIVAGCAAAGLDNSPLGTNGAGNTSTTTPTGTSVPMPSSTTQPLETGTEIPGPEWSVPLSAQMQETAETAIRKLLEDERFQLALGPELWANRYYGTYGDCAVIFTEGEMTAITKLVLGEQTISHWSSFAIYVCKNGEAYTLLDAYNSGWLTDDDITLIRQYHNACNQAFRDWVNSHA